MDAPIILLLRAPRAPTQAFLQGSIAELREADPNWIRQRGVLHIEPFRRPIFGRLLRGTGWISGRGDAPYFGSAHLIYRPLMRTGYEAKQPLPQRKMGLDAQEQLAKSYKARDVQNRGRREVVKLESIELQEPSEKRMYGKSESPY